MKRILIVAKKEFSDRFRNGWVIACTLVWLGAIGLTSLFGLIQIGRIGFQGCERTVISLLNVVQYLVPLLGLLLGHDLVVSEREERTLPLVLSTGLTRTRLLLGKFVGGVFTVTVPLVLGFLIAGTVIKLGAGDGNFKPFLTLAASGLLLGVVFLGFGLLISSLCRTRVQSLVVALLTWCVVVFVFDLVALGMLISTKAPAAAQEIDAACDAMHMNSAADVHAAFDLPAHSQSTAKTGSDGDSFSWLLINPVDLFRTVNLSEQTQVHLSPTAAIASVLAWLAASLYLSIWKLKRLDL